MKKKRKKSIPPIACADETIAIEDLPYPIVLYPIHYGAFFVFKETIDSNEFFMCECSKKALFAFLELHATYDSPYNAYISYKNNFAISFFEYIYSNNEIHTYSDFYEAVIFQENLCHKCNQKIPTYSYCHPMYGTKFMQNYGWYVTQKTYEFGIYFSSYGLKCLVKYAPNEIKNDFQYLLTNLSNSTNDQINITNEAIKKINNYIENSVRIEFSVYKIGERWNNETSLYKIVTSIMIDRKVVFHYRPACINNLELDIFIPDYNLGLEYQGIQHFKSIKHFGGTDAFIKRRMHDIEKERLCRENGIILIYFTYLETITYELVMEKLSPYIICP